MSEFKVINEIDYSANGDDIDSFAQKVKAEFPLVYAYINRLRRLNAGAGTDVSDSVSYEMRVDTVSREILIRNETNDGWYVLGKVAAGFGLNASTINAIENNGGMGGMQIGLDSNKPTDKNSSYDFYWAYDTKKVYYWTDYKWALFMSLNFSDLIDVEDVITSGDVATSGKGKILKLNETGKADVDITGSAAKLIGYVLNSANIADGKIFVYRTAANGFVLEDKSSGGSGTGAAIDDTEAATDKTYSSFYIAKLLADKQDSEDASIEAYSILRDDSGRIITITANSSTYALTYDSSGRLNTIALTVGTLTNTVKALYNSYGQYQGLQKVGA